MRSNLTDLAFQAIRYAEAETARRHAQYALNDAYREWRKETGITEDIGRGSEEWASMMGFTRQEYRSLVRAKRKERYHREYLLKLARRVAS